MEKSDKGSFEKCLDLVSRFSAATHTAHSPNADTNAALQVRNDIFRSVVEDIGRYLCSRCQHKKQHRVEIGKLQRQIAK